MKKQKIKQEIIEKVLKDDHVSFVEVERIFEAHHFDYEGNKSIQHDRYTHLLFWGGWNDAALEIMAEVLSENKICFERSDYVNYLIDGFMPNMALASDIKDYKMDHWIPMLLRPEN